MSDVQPSSILEAQTVVPVTFEKHLRRIAAEIESLMININELNRSNRLHDGGLFLSGLFTVMTALYSDVDDQPTAGVSIDDLVALLAESEGRLRTLVSGLDAKELPSLAGSNAVAVLRTSAKDDNGVIFYKTAFQKILKLTQEAVILCESETALSKEGETLTILAR